jgi:hypothetical protein
MKKYICLFIVTMLLISGVFVRTGKASVDLHTVMPQDLETMTLAELRMLIQQMNAEAEMQTRDIRKAFANGLVEDYAPNHSGYLLFAEHYPQTTKYMEEKISLALTSPRKTKANPSEIAEQVRDLPWTLFDAITVSDSLREDFIRTDYSRTHPTISQEDLEYHVNLISDAVNRGIAERSGRLARWFIEKEIKLEAARESKERAAQIRAHQQEHPAPNVDLRYSPNGMVGPTGPVMATPGGPGGQRGGGLDGFPRNSGARTCTQIDTITYGANGEVVSVTYRIVPCP